MTKTTHESSVLKACTDAWADALAKQNIKPVAGDAGASAQGAVLARQAFIDKTGAVRPEPASNAYGMDFGDAIRCLKRGQRVQRHGWNGKNTWLELQVPDAHSKMSLPYVFMKTADEKLVPWLASQTDVLGDDWRVVA